MFQKEKEHVKLEHNPTKTLGSKYATMVCSTYQILLITTEYSDHLSPLNAAMQRTSTQKEQHVTRK